MEKRQFLVVVIVAALLLAMAATAGYFAMRQWVSHGTLIELP